MYWRPILNVYVAPGGRTTFRRFANAYGRKRFENREKIIMPRFAKENTEAVNPDSFLDIVASVVSIMIIMVVMEGSGSRMRRYRRPYKAIRLRPNWKKTSARSNR